MMKFLRKGVSRVSEFFRTVFKKPVTGCEKPVTGCSMYRAIVIPELPEKRKKKKYSHHYNHYS